MVVGFDDGSTHEATRIGNRLRRSAHADPPVAGTGTGPSGATPGTAGLELLAQLGSPAQIHKGGTASARDLDTSEGPAMAERPVGDIFTALGGQTDVVPGTDAAALILPGLADSLQAVLDQRKLLPARIQELLPDHPHPKAPRTMPGIGISTGARNLIDVGDGSSFPPTSPPVPASPRQPAARAPRSVASHRPDAETKQLKRAFFLSAFTPSPAPPPHPLRQKDQPGQAPHPSPPLPLPDTQPTSSPPRSETAPLQTTTRPITLSKPTEARRADRQSRFASY